MHKTSPSPRKLPGPWSWQHTTSALMGSIGFYEGQKIGGITGGILGLLAGLGFSLIILLVWVSRPRKRG